jgi:hypothetical protein
MESIGVSSFALNHNKKSSPARLNMRLPSPKADIKAVAAKPLGDRPAGEAVKVGNGTIEELFADLKSDDAQTGPAVDGEAETLHLLHSPENAEALAESIAELEAGRGIKHR